MTGLGMFYQKIARALAPRGLLRSAYDFLCLIYEEWSSQGIVEWSRAVSIYARSCTQKNVFWAPQRGFGDAVLYTKT
jgi:hypothetical protein